MTRINRRGISKHMSYTVRELSDRAHVTEKTIWRWIGEGLPVVPGGKKPTYIKGSDAIEFLRNKNAKKKFKLKRHEFLCLKCKAPRRAKRGSIKMLSDRKIALCCVCNGKMSRTIKPYQKGLFDTPP
jgi:hypothetical protein